MASSLPRTCLIGVLLFSLSLFSHANQSPSYDALFRQNADNAQLQTLAQRLNSGETAQGNFTQYRYLKVLKKPLVSHGQFLFQNQQGLAWLQTRPFASGLVLTQGALIQIDSDGNRQVSQTQNNQQANALAQMMPTLMNGLLQGEIAPLASQFSLFLLQEGQQWQLGLVPLDPLIKQAMPKLVLQGEQQLQQLILLGHNGDRSEIHFEQITNQPLTEQQLNYFSSVTPKPAQ
ncbi:hypothetical protein TUM4644_08640 [Shewanella colwelliana]|uniref:outer membrane lipoprotein carrier protein LolA n=1 Tax=Shewanella colwelliana TaxID=23 RepID=UPI001BC37715|nr:outer membrane lipoprotein carrier protein LolA [Shewanella colwelliana]GIU20044.1 hypothetical protein TUM4644_08640 [Shewanella colwelliana]